VYGEFRITCGACIDAGCADRCPTEAMLKAIAYVCTLRDIWERADYIMHTENLNPTNFQEITNLFLHAEHQLSWQDPQVTLAKALRAAIDAHEKSAHQIKTPGPVLSPNDSNSDTDALDINATPEFLALCDIFAKAPPLKDRQTVVQYGQTYYDFPLSLPKFSVQFRQALDKQERCTNCANADVLFPPHIWKQCPFVTNPYRKKPGWADWHVPIKSIADGGSTSVAPDPSPSNQRLMRVFPVSVHSADIPSSKVYECNCGECDTEAYESPARAPTIFAEPPPYRGITTRINPGISDADRGYTHIF